MPNTSDLEQNGWSVEGETLVKQFKFKTFVQAFGWMSSVALEAEKADHHPDWSNSYNTVTVHLTTHSAKALTEKDTALAHKMDALT
ncbi:4a-hydroxytetrahydrobiopterin dehydratase [Vannielia sp.]|uniref:4a-hydroxytetrahydrobiopterin dehydratase n=1 Tax=Vannielia sp. TaxID=2813045 RepID=UPI0026346F81|nr:4a-hydroxytetrahydrobiopterin dehydratase [Vannielia sp.]MDF1872028.1 4a-hydroxytetrahydrobiopterin dehydratase [Vannielia sp.]